VPVLAAIAAVTELGDCLTANGNLVLQKALRHRLAILLATGTILG